MDKGTIINILSIIPLSIALLIYYIRQHLKQKKTLTETVKVNSDGQFFIDELNKLGYYKYTATEHLAELKSETLNEYEQHGYLSTIERNDLPVDYRLFPADAEDIFEEGGFIKVLHLLKNAFHIRKLSLEINEHFEEYLNNIANQWVIVNNRKYVIYENLEGHNASWQIATDELVSLINKELRQQSSDEQMYVISGGNDAKIIFLNSIQFDFINTFNLQNEFKPRP